MKILQQFEVSHSREKVWEIFDDLSRVASCFPGAQITRPLQNDSFSGQVAMTLGPMRLQFKGDGSLSRDKNNWRGTIQGDGADTVTKSKASAILAYSLSNSSESGTIVQVEVEYKLFGALAQVGRPALVQEVANHLTGEFKKNLNEQIVGENPLERQERQSNSSLNVIGLFMRMLAVRFSFFRSLFSREKNGNLGNRHQ